MYCYFSADIRVSSFTLILSVDYLMKIADFFRTTAAPKVDEEPPPTTSTHKTPSSKRIDIVEPTTMQMTVNLKVEMPDIVLVEHMDNVDANAMILNVSLVSYYRLGGSLEKNRHN